MSYVLRAGCSGLSGVVLALSLFVTAIVWADSVSPWFSRTMQSSSGKFTVTLEAVESEIALNEFRTWHLIVKDHASGNAVTPARITVGGGMPMHGHGLPSHPQVTQYLGDGRYMIEGLKFNMLGKWILEFGIVSKLASDTVKFEFLLDY